MSQKPFPAVFYQHPGMVGQRRVMAHVLPVAAGQNSPPIPHFVLVKTDNGLLHCLTGAPSDTRQKPVKWAIRPTKTAAQATRAR